MDNMTNLNVTGLLPNTHHEFRVQAVAMLLDVPYSGMLSDPTMGRTGVTGKGSL